jgi:hypothetical protein
VKHGNAMWIEQRIHQPSWIYHWQWFEIRPLPVNLSRPIRVAWPSNCMERSILRSQWLLSWSRNPPPFTKLEGSIPFLSQINPARTHTHQLKTLFNTDLPCMPKTPNRSLLEDIPAETLHVSHLSRTVSRSILAR